MATTELNINWAVFDSIQRGQVEKAVENGHYEEIAAILFEVSPEQAIEIEKIQRQLRPREFKFASKAQQDFEDFTNPDKFSIHDLTPEMVNEWQEKIDKEKAEKLQALNGGIVKPIEAQNIAGSNETGGIISNDLNDVKGLGPASVKRLNAANIYSVDELRKLPQDKRLSILGPLVVGKIKSLI